MSSIRLTTVNPAGGRRVLVTKDLPGERWRQLLVDAGCRIEIVRGSDTLDEKTLTALIGERCDAAIGQLTEPWSASVLEALAKAGAAVFSTYAVGYNNVDVAAATRLRLPVGNTPGVLTETTAEMAVALTFAAARRVAEGDRAARAGQFTGWLPTLMLGELLWRKALGVVGPGRIGTAYARMMVEGHKMSLIYYGPHKHEELEEFVSDYSAFLAARGEDPLACHRAVTLDELLAQADVVSLHPALTDATRHLIGRPQLALMKESAVLVNTSRGQVLDEGALVGHCQQHPAFRAGLDVYEEEPRLHPGLRDLENVVLAPHLGSATRWTREGMATLAATNVAALIQGWPVWPRAITLSDVEPFLEEAPPRAAPSIVNAAELGLATHAPR